MKKIAFLLVAAALAGGFFSSPAIGAGQIEINTYYDVPDGDFRNLTVTGNTQLGSAGGDVIFNGGGAGFTTIGTNNPGTTQLLVVGNMNGVTASFMDNANAGVNLGGSGAAVGVVESRAGDLRLNRNGGAVNFGGPYGSAAGFQVSDASGAGTYGLTQGGQTGQVRVAYASGGGVSGYYATYSN